MPIFLFTKAKKCDILNNGGPSGRVWLVFLFAVIPIWIIMRKAEKDLGEASYKKLPLNCFFVYYDQSKLTAIACLA